MRKIEGIEHHEGKILNRKCTVCGEDLVVKLGKGGEIPVLYFFSRNLGESLGIEGDEYWECQTCSGYIKDRMTEWMFEHWGERCPDHVSGCSLCEAWKCFDFLFKDTNEE